MTRKKERPSKAVLLADHLTDVHWMWVSVAGRAYEGTHSVYKAAKYLRLQDKEIRKLKARIMELEGELNHDP